MSSVVDLAAARLEAAVGPARIVYRHAVPAQPARRYLWAYSNVPLADSDDLGHSLGLRSVTLWINSTSINVSRESAAAEAMWAAERAQEALTRWRPSGAHWMPVPLSSQPPQVDEDLPDATTVYVVATWGFQFQSS